MAVRCGPCLLAEKGNQPFKTKCLRKLTCISKLEHKTDVWLWSKTNFLFGSTGTSSGNGQETETHMVQACYVPQQRLQNHPSGHLGGWATPWSVEETLDGQRIRMDIPAYARTAHKSLLQERLEGYLC